MSSLSDSSRSGRSSFQQVVGSFLSQPELPLAGVLSAARIERIFARHGNLFGTGAIYSTAVMVWSLLAQVWRDGQEASCQAAVARVVVYQQQRGAAVPTSDTGDYCRARNKLSEAALRDVSREVAAEIEQQADDEWLCKGRHAKLVDGFTFTLPDTPQNQTEYPQQKSQQTGVGLPIARAVAILSLATACAMELAIGRYAGQETGETALPAQVARLVRRGRRGGDGSRLLFVHRDYCSFMMIALLRGRNVEVCARMHQRRPVDFRRGRRLGKYDHLIVWTKPQRPAWMDQATYEAIPQTLELREIRDHVVQPGYRTKTITVATTLTDAEVYSPEEIAELYRRTVWFSLPQ